MSTNTCPFHTPRPARQIYSKLDKFLLHLRNVSAAAQQTCYSTTFHKYTVGGGGIYLALSRSLAGLHLLYTITSIGICTFLCSVVNNLGSGCQLWLEYHDPLPESPHGKFPVCPLTPILNANFTQVLVDRFCNTAGFALSPNRGLSLRTQKLRAKNWHTGQ